MTTTHASTTTVLDRVDLTSQFLDDLVDTVAASDPTQREELEVTAPYTDEPVASVPMCSSDDVRAAVERAHTAQQHAETDTIGERIEQLERFGTLVQHHSDRLLDLVQLETGKSRQDAIQEVTAVPGAIDHYADVAADVLPTRERGGAVPVLTETREYHEPRGVVGVISPWNYPLTLALEDALPALFAGNAVVLKPDERTPLSTLFAVQLLEEAGVPPDLVQVVTGDGATVGGTLIETADYIAFTGGVETGRRVGAQAGEQLIDCSLELGGKNPLVVLEDADPERAAKGAIQACFSNAGQLCLSAERLYVHEAVFDEFVEAFVARTEALDLGATFDYDPDVGSLIGSMQLETVQEHVADAKERGATVLAGGTHRPDVGPYFYEPTILRDVPDEATAACSETFGPVVSVYPVQSRDEAIERANDTEYGLTASVWTEDADAGWATAEAIDAGMVGINDGFAAGWGSLASETEPIGDSGVGARHGREGLARYTRSKTVARQRFGPLDMPDGVPGSVLVKGMFALQRVRGWLGK